MKKLLWFRRDLRIEDSALLSIGGEVQPLFIFDPHILDTLEADDRRVGFIFDRVLALKKALQNRGLDLWVFYAAPEAVFDYLKTRGFAKVYASVDYDAYAKKRDDQIGQIMEFVPLNDSYIFEPNEVLKSDGTPYLVFTPFFKQALKLYTPAHHHAYPFAAQKLAAPVEHKLHCLENKTLSTKPLKIQSLGFAPQKLPFVPPEKKLESFARKIDHYEQRRDFLSEDITSHLGIDLRFGTVSIREVLRTLVAFKKRGLQTREFFRQLLFREFYAYLLYHFPRLEKEDHKPLVRYEYNREYFERFTSAQTGVPLVDAGVSQLLRTGQMHNRARMVAASFFTKHLLQWWKEGERFFAAHLLDYDAASNVLSWQWAAGTGIDPQPYFRIFNPYTQAQKFDKDAAYIKTQLPQLRDLDAKRLHSEDFLLENGVENYPKPIVVHKEARTKALAAQIKP